MTALLPDDDAFIRTAIRGLRPPEHHPDFWDVLAGDLDAVTEELLASGLLGPPAAEALAAAAVAPEAEDPAPAPDPGPVPSLEDDPYAPVLEPTHDVYGQPYAEAPPVVASDAAAEPEGISWNPPTRRADVDHPPRRAPLRASDADPTAVIPATPAARHKKASDGPVVRHDPAALPRAMRRTSNAVLAAIAVAAAVVALVAGLTLVRERSEDGGAPAGTETPVTPEPAG